MPGSFVIGQHQIRAVDQRQRASSASGGFIHFEAGVQQLKLDNAA